MSAAEYEGGFLQYAGNCLLDARLQSLVLGADPTAGAEVSVTVPGGEFWKVLSVVVTLVADATAVNRRPVLTFDDGATVYHRSPTPQDITANLTVKVSWQNFGEKTSGVAFGEDVGLLMPDGYLQPGHRIRTSTFNIVAGDNYGAPAVLIRRYSPSDIVTVGRDVENEIAESYGN